MTMSADDKECVRCRSIGWVSTRSLCARCKDTPADRLRFFAESAATAGDLSGVELDDETRSMCLRALDAVFSRWSEDPLLARRAAGAWLETLGAPTVRIVAPDMLPDVAKCPDRVYVACWKLLKKGPLPGVSFE